MEKNGEKKSIKFITLNFLEFRGRIIDISKITCFSEVYADDFFDNNKREFFIILSGQKLVFNVSFVDEAKEQLKIATFMTDYKYLKDIFIAYMALGGFLENLIEKALENHEQRKEAGVSPT